MRDLQATEGQGVTIAPDPFLLAAELFDPVEDPEQGREAKRAADREQDRAECAASSRVFIERHASLEDPKGRVLPFNLWPCQRETLRVLEAEDKVIILKGRRLGMSWVVLAFALWLAIFSQGIRILVLCKKEGDAIKLLGRIRRMRNRILEAPESAHILEGLAPGEDAKTTLDVGESTITALVGTEDAARSETAGLIILDEFAFQRGAAEIWQAALPAAEGGGKVCALSTGNGAEKGKRLGAEFAKQWRRARQGLSGFTALFFNWRERPGRDDAWYAVQEAELGDPMKARIEHPTSEDDAFLVADADLIYPGSHLDAVARLGAEANASDGRLVSTGYLGIDWGVHTHMVAGVQTPGGGLRLMAEYYSDRADLEVDVARCGQMLDDLGAIHVCIRYDPGAAGAKVVGTFLRLLRTRCPRVTFEVLKIPFSKFKVPAIQYAQLLARRAADGEAMRVLAAAEADVPEILRQMRAAEWKDADIGRTEKGDDHGADAVLTLTAELGYRMFATEGGMG